MARRQSAGQPEERTSLDPDRDRFLIDDRPTVSTPSEDGQATGAVAEKGPKEPEEEEHGGIAGFFRELPGLIIIAFALALLIKTFLIQAFYIP
ncbi:MAG TPA: hypothetical protein VJP08_03655, partial [Actinomycetota bacterium]|nr:hypothetical protein [Actinomycetota bacterium]